MNKYQVKIDRGAPADRWTEAFLALDNYVDVGGGTMLPAYLTQDPTKDNYIIAESESLEMLWLQLIETEAISPLQRRRNDAGAILDDILVREYPMIHNRNYKPSDTLRAGATADLYVIDTGAMTSHASIADAMAVANALDPTYGWYLVDEKSDENPHSLVVDSRPSENTQDEFGETVYINPVVLSRPKQA